MSKIKIIVDSSSDIRRDFVRKNDIAVIPLNVSFGDEQYLDYYDFSPQAFYKKVKITDAFPKTSQPNPNKFMDYFQKCEGLYDDVLCITLSSNGSGTYHSAVMAAKEYQQNPKNKTRIHIFDTEQASQGVALFVYRAIDLLKSGTTDIAAIIKKLSEIKKRVATYVIPETLEYLKKGGRVNTVTGVVGNLLDIRPIITILDGWGRNYGKVRGIRQAQNKLCELFCEQYGQGDVFISHGNCEQKAKELINMLNKQCKNIHFILSEFGCTMGSHVGPGSLGIFFVRKENHFIPQHHLLPSLGHR